MELRQLQFFIAVAQTLNFRKAAERLHITQPSVSRQVRKLEEELGVALFVRDRKQVRLTDSGRLVLRKARGLIADAAQLAEAAGRANSGETGSVKVGVGIPLAKSIQGIATQYARRFPKVDVQYQDVFTNAQNDALRRREIDVGILWPPIDRVHLVSERLFDEHFWVILRKSSPLAKRRKLRLKELADQVLLLPNQTQATNKRVMQMARDAGVTLKVVHTTALPHEAGAALVASGKGIYVLAGTPLKFPSFGSGIVNIPLDEPSSVEIHMAWRKGETSAAILNFLKIARQVFKRT